MLLIEGQSTQCFKRFVGAGEIGIGIFRDATERLEGSPLRVHDGAHARIKWETGEVRTPCNAQAPAIAERREAAFLSVNAEDAQTLGVKNGDEIEIALDGGLYRLPLVIAPELVPGLAAMSAFLPGTAGHALPGWATLRPVSNAEPVPCG